MQHIIKLESKISEPPYLIKANEYYAVQKEIIDYLALENPKLIIQGLVYCPWGLTALKDTLARTAYRVVVYTPDYIPRQMCGRAYIRFTVVLCLIGLHDL